MLNMELPKNHFGAILADPPWRFRTYDNKEGVGKVKSPIEGAASFHYLTMATPDICALPVSELAAADCSLFLWCSWPQLPDALEVIRAWGFEFKTCGFLWAKAHARQLEMFQDHIDAYMGLGYWTRANSEPCLLATRGRPKRLNADVKQAIIEPRREHSRKPDCTYDRIERLVAGPYLELFARTQRPGWTAWGNEINRFTTPEEKNA
jgi:N6-adenosine-specific RNA methylase IME4